jgi:hypothetical protein
MNVRKGIFARVADRLRGPETRKPRIIDRAPREHGDDDYMHASERVDVEHDHRSGAPEELDRGFGERASNDAVNSER